MKKLISKLAVCMLAFAMLFSTTQLHATETAYQQDAYRQEPAAREWLNPTALWESVGPKYSDWSMSFAVEHRWIACETPVGLLPGDPTQLQNMLPVETHGVQRSGLREAVRGIAPKNVEMARNRDELLPNTARDGFAPREAATFLHTSLSDVLVVGFQVGESFGDETLVYLEISDALTGRVLTRAYKVPADELLRTVFSMQDRQLSIDVWTSNGAPVQLLVGESTVSLGLIEVNMANLEAYLASNPRPADEAGSGADPFVPFTEDRTHTVTATMQQLYSFTTSMQGRGRTDFVRSSAFTTLNIDMRMNGVSVGGKDVDVGGFVRSTMLASGTVLTVHAKAPSGSGTATFRSGTVQL